MFDEVREGNRVAEDADREQATHGGDELSFMTSTKARVVER
jgi:hypothetical protein